MRRKITILISSAGRRVGLIQCFRADAARLEIELEVISVDVDPAMSAACQVADAAFSVPRCTAPDFVDRLLELCHHNNVDLAIPTIDTELETLSLNKHRFAEIGTELALSSPEVVRLARDKLETVRFLKASGIPVPRTTVDEGRALEGWTWQLILKPDAVGTSRNVMKHMSPKTLGRMELAECYIVQEFMRGEEYTVDIFFDKDGHLRCAIPHLRYEVRAGELSKGITRRHQPLEAVARKLGAILPGPRGPLYFQAIVNEDEEVGVSEINARFGGGFPLAHAAGARFSQWLLEEVAGLRSCANNDWREGVTMLHYDSAIFC